MVKSIVKRNTRSTRKARNPQILIREAFAAASAQAQEKGFQPPVHIATVGRNGSFMFCRFSRSEDGLNVDAEVLAAYEDASGYELPINMLMVDATGKEVRASIGGDGSDSITIH